MSRSQKHLPLARRFSAQALALLLLGLGLGGAATEPGTDPAPGEPPTTAGAAPAGPVAAQPADPARACLDAARGRSRDAYRCDLAVQMARDTGIPAALAAALANRSLVLAADGRLQPALDDVNEALSLTPGAADLHGNRGNLLLRLGRPGDALNAHDRAIELHPEDPVGYYNRAFSYLALGQLQRAEQDVNAARSLVQRPPSATTERR